MGKKTNNDIKAPAAAKRAAAPATKVKPSALPAAIAATPKTVAPKVAPVVAKKTAKPAAKVVPPPAPKPVAVAPKVASPKAAAPKRESKPVAAPAPAPTYTSDDVGLRAYFIAEKRQQNGIDGDSHSDWIEAERQLAEEAAAASKPKAKSKKA